LRVSIKAHRTMDHVPLRVLGAGRSRGETGDQPGAAELPIAETFTSIQGEGRLAGAPSHFIRVSGCNLRCVWCDTPYASWAPEGDRRSLESLAAGAAGSGVRHVVVTGGEPMLFAGVAPLTRQLRAAGLHVTIETAGTIWRDVECDLMSVSPKLSNSIPRDDERDPAGAWAARHESRRLAIDVLERLVTGPWETQLKFVVAEPGDLEEIDELLGSVAGWRPEDVMLMPEGVEIETLRSRSWVSEACLERGWRYSPRLHILLYGNRRGT